MNAWAGIEIGSAYLLAAILKTESQLAMAILGTVTSYKARRDIITNTARMVLVNEDDLNAVERICKRLARAAKRRNQIAHATLSYHPEHPGKLMVMNLDPEMKAALMHYSLFSPADLKRVLEQFQQLHADIAAVIEQTRRAERHALLGTQM